MSLGVLLVSGVFGRCCFAERARSQENGLLSVPRGRRRRFWRRRRPFFFFFGEGEDVRGGTGRVYNSRIEKCLRKLDRRAYS